MSYPALRCRFLHIILEHAMKPPEPGNTDRLGLTVDEVAYELGIGRTTAYTRCRTGEIPVLRLGRRLVIPRAALEALLSSVGPK